MFGCLPAEASQKPAGKQVFLLLLQRQARNLQASKFSSCCCRGKPETCRQASFPVAAAGKQVFLLLLQASKFSCCCCRQASFPVAAAYLQVFLLSVSGLGFRV